MGRFARVCAGYVLACVAAAYTKLLFMTTPAQLSTLPSDLLAERMTDILSRGWKYAVLFVIFSLPFAVIAIAVAEWRRLGGWQYCVLSAIAISMVSYVARYNGEAPGDPTIVNNYALLAYVTTGFVAGLLYWLVAGRSSGRRIYSAEPEAEPAPVVPAPASKPPRAGGEDVLVTPGKAADAAIPPEKKHDATKTGAPPPSGEKKA